jgi:hypothetical protein
LEEDAGMMGTYILLATSDGAVRLEVFEHSEDRVRKTPQIYVTY